MLVWKKKKDDQINRKKKNNNSMNGMKSLFCKMSADL